MTRSFKFLLGLPTLRPGALWSRATPIGAPVLLSANALSRWRNDGLGLRHWDVFDGRHLGLVSHHKVALDSAGFEIEWTVVSPQTAYEMAFLDD